MINRYSRKSVPLEIRGTSQSSFEVQPHSNIFINEQDHQVFSYTPPHSPNREDDAETLTESSASPPWVGGGGWMRDEQRGSMWKAAEGEETDRTSLSSSDWGDEVCEFDFHESHRVHLMLQQIDNFLFSDLLPPSSTSTILPNIPQDAFVVASLPSGARNQLDLDPPVHIRTECADWRATFPHIRVLGSSLGPGSQDAGVSFHAHESQTNMDEILSPTLTAQTSASTFTFGDNAVRDEVVSVASSKYSDSLSLQGHRVVPSATSNSNQEETIIEEGYFQDFIALDSKSNEDDDLSKSGRLVHSNPFHRKKRYPRGFPPLTPSALIRDSIGCSLFDILWTEVVSWMRSLVQETINHIHQGLDLVESLPATPLPPPSFSIASRMIHPQRSHSIGLADILQISSKTLQMRDRMLELTDRPESSVTARVSFSGMGHTHLQPRSISAKRNLVSKNGTNTGRLAPLDLVPALEADALGLLRGHSLIDKSGPTRSGALPPLSSSPNALSRVVHSKEQRPATMQTLRSDGALARTRHQSFPPRVLGIHGNAISHMASHKEEESDDIDPPSTHLYPAGGTFIRNANWVG